MFYSSIAPSLIEFHNFDKVVLSIVELRPSMVASWQHQHIFTMSVFFSTELVYRAGICSLDIIRSRLVSIQKKKSNPTIGRVLRGTNAISEAAPFFGHF